MGAWEARPDSTPHSTPLMAGLITGRADAQSVPAWGSARAEGDAPTGGILTEQREGRISDYGPRASHHSGRISIDHRLSKIRAMAHVL